MEFSGYKHPSWAWRRGIKSCAHEIIHLSCLQAGLGMVNSNFSLPLLGRSALGTEARLTTFPHQTDYCPLKASSLSQPRTTLT